MSHQEGVAGRPAGDGEALGAPFPSAPSPGPWAAQAGMSAGQGAWSCVSFTNCLTSLGLCCFIRSWFSLYSRKGQCSRSADRLPGCNPPPPLEGCVASLSLSVLVCKLGSENGVVLALSRELHVLAQAAGILGSPAPWGGAGHQSGPLVLPDSSLLHPPHRPPAQLSSFPPQAAGLSPLPQDSPAPRARPPAFSRLQAPQGPAPSLRAFPVNPGRGSEPLLQVSYLLCVCFHKQDPPSCLGLRPHKTWIRPCVTSQPETHEVNCATPAHPRFDNLSPPGPALAAVWAVTSPPGGQVSELRFWEGTVLGILSQDPGWQPPNPRIAQVWGCGSPNPGPRSVPHTLGYLWLELPVMPSSPVIECLLPHWSPTTCKVLHSAWGEQ